MLVAPAAAPANPLQDLKKHRHIYIVCLLSALLFAAARRTYAAPSSGRDDYIFSEVDHRQGLSHSSVICIYKDDSELMWFGTYDGVNCFDGKQMETFRTDFSQARSQSLGM